MKQKKTTFYCFSPPVMVATFVIESALLMYVLWRYKMSPLTRVVVLILAMLATFQLAEYNVCGDSSAYVWSRIGFVAITLLPPLGLHLAHLIAKRRANWLVFTAYATAAIWILLFATSNWAFRGQECSGNYVIFQLKDIITKPYGLYYHGWLAVAVVWASQAAKSQKPRQKKALVALIAGYFVFLIPTASLNVLQPASMAGIPSIMCGFAVFFALILVAFVLPHATTKRDRR